ncbi:hypothetical protein C8Q75DRAFT_809983 [Abortiporus biennis]|nr:hypothetical protein C8Q75DRAFT_809983 [Abortiporus biennis]
MRKVTIAVIGPHLSGRSTLAAQLNFQVMKRPTDGQLFCFKVVDVGEHLSQDISFDHDSDFDFAISTFDLTAPNDSKANRESAYASLCQYNSKVHRQLNACLVGTKKDLVLQTSYDLALAMHGSRRSLGLVCPSLKIFAVNARTGEGCKELLWYIANTVKPTKNTPLTSLLLHSIENFQTWIADQFAAIMALPVPESVNRQTPDSGEMNDEIITHLLESPETREWDEAFKRSVPGSLSTCHKITSDLVVKFGTCNPTQYHNMEYVRSHTRIPVPQPRYPHLKSTWLVMDCVHGSMLHDCWESQLLWMKIRIACTLRGYIKQLRNLRSTRPGNIDDGVICDNELFDSHECGPFASSTGLRVYCEQVAHAGWLQFVSYQRRRENHQQANEPKYPVPEFYGETDWDLVFTHCDLNMGNIMLSHDGFLWIVDWANSGFYPPWMESVGIKRTGPPASFERFRRFIAGDYPAYEHFWDWLMTEVHRGYAEPRSL